MSHKFVSANLEQMFYLIFVHYFIHPLSSLVTNVFFFSESFNTSHEFFVRFGSMTYQDVNNCVESRLTIFVDKPFDLDEKYMIHNPHIL